MKPLAKLFRGRRATFARVAPGAAAKITRADDALTLDVGAAGSDGHVSIRCDYAVLATGASLAPISDDRLHAGSVASRRERLEAQVAAVLRPNVTSALVVGGGLTGVELAAELAEYFGNGSRPPLATLAAPVGAAATATADADASARVTLCVGPDPVAGLLPGFADCVAARRYAAEHLAARGVRVLESWAVPPPDGGGAVATSVPAGSPRWRDAGEIPASFFRVCLHFDGARSPPLQSPRESRAEVGDQSRGVSSGGAPRPPLTR